MSSTSSPHVRQIIPAVLTNDPRELQQLFLKLQGVSGWLQLDIMDNTFVPYSSVGIEELKNIKHQFSLEAHLMVGNPEKYFSICNQVGIKRVIFHVEASSDIDRDLAMLVEMGMERGLALNPETPIEKILPYLDQTDIVLFLGVNPGQQGQAFIPSVLDKVKALKIESPDSLVELDGGIKAENITLIAEAGVDLLVVGSAIVKAEQPAQAYKELQAKIQ